MSLIGKVAERVIETVTNTTEPMLISGNPSLISPAPAAAASPMPVIALFLVFATVVGIGVVLWRSNSRKLLTR